MLAGSAGAGERCLGEATGPSAEKLTAQHLPGFVCPGERKRADKQGSERWNELIFLCMGVKTAGGLESVLFQMHPFGMSIFKCFVYASPGTQLLGEISVLTWLIKH